MRIVSICPKRFLTQYKYTIYGASGEHLEIDMFLRNRRKIRLKERKEQQREKGEENIREGIVYNNEVREIKVRKGYILDRLLDRRAGKFGLQSAREGYDR